MENIESAINLLNAIYSTMNTICVTGIENQDKFVGCANAIQTVSCTLEKIMMEKRKEENNG
jgi:hypothetical protein